MTSAKPAAPVSELEKAIAAARAQGLTRYRIIKRGREVVIEVDETEARRDLDDEKRFEEAVGV